ncbi:MAG TPA: hypothetical protein VLY24_27060 [Bryobacteraceae bacterium]|nr:hypothetical protein [Bryobacteraceae bacterium]
MGDNESTASEESIERQFLEEAVNWSRLSRANNDPKRANKVYDRLYKLLKRKMRRFPDRGEAALKRISNIDDLGVQLMAATALLAVDEAFATKLLERIRDTDPGLISFDAKMTLPEWRKGSIREYWS